MQFLLLIPFITKTQTIVKHAEINRHGALRFRLNQINRQLPVGIDNLALLTPYRCPRFIDARRVGSGNFKSRIHTALLCENKTHTAFFHDRC